MTYRDKLLEPVEWKDHYTVGVSELDQEHHHLISLVNDCISLVNSAQDTRENLQPILNQMINYTLVHFEKEEQMMQDAGYPHLDDHKHEHKEFYRFIQQSLEKFERGTLTVTDLLKFLKDWFDHHLSDMDKDYIPYLAAKNRKA